MDWKDDEVNRRLNTGNLHHSSVFGMMEEAKAIRRDVEREERTRMIEEENNLILKQHLLEAQNANTILEEQNKKLTEANKKLEIQIDDYRKEAKSSKRTSIISILIAGSSLIVAIISIVLSVVLK